MTLISGCPYQTLQLIQNGVVLLLTRTCMRKSEVLSYWMQIFACNWRVGLPWKGFSQQPACRPKLKTYKKRYYFFLLKIRKKEKSSTSQGHFRPHHIINSCNCQHNYYIELMYFATKLSVTMLRFKGSHHVSLSHNSAPSVYQDACILR